MICILVLIGIILIVSIALYILHRQNPKAFHKQAERIRSAIASVFFFCCPCCKRHVAPLSPDRIVSQSDFMDQNGVASLGDVNLDVLCIAESETSHARYLPKNNVGARPDPLVRPELPSDDVLFKEALGEGSESGFSTHSSGSGPRVESDLESKSGTCSANVDKELLGRRR